VGGVLSALLTEFIQLDFFGDVNLVTFSDIVLGFADAANKTKDLTGTFFGHSFVILLETASHVYWVTGGTGVAAAGWVGMFQAGETGAGALESGACGIVAGAMGTTGSGATGAMTTGSGAITGGGVTTGVGLKTGVGGTLTVAAAWSILA